MTRDPYDADRLLAGGSAEAHPELAALLDGVRALAADAPAPSPALAALLRDGLDPATVTGPADVPHWAPATSRRAFRSPVARVAGLTLAAKVALGAGVAAASIGTAAGTGVLPEPVQERMTGVIDAVNPFSQPAPVAPPVDEDRPELAPSQTEPSSAATPTARPTPVGVPTVLPEPSRRPDAVPAPTAPGRRNGTAPQTGPSEAPERDERVRDTPRPERGAADRDADEQDDDRDAGGRSADGRDADDRDRAEPGADDRDAAEPRGRTASGRPTPSATAAPETEDDEDVEDRFVPRADDAADRRPDSAPGARDR